MSKWCASFLITPVLAFNVWNVFVHSITILTILASDLW